VYTLVGTGVSVGGIGMSVGGIGVLVGSGVSVQVGSGVFVKSVEACWLAAAWRSALSVRTGVLVGGRLGRSGGNGQLVGLPGWKLGWVCCG
jgi:hypothetical protein